MLAGMPDNVRIYNPYTRKKARQAKETVAAQWKQVIEKNGLDLEFPVKKEIVTVKPAYRNPFKPLKRPAPGQSSSPVPTLPLKKARKEAPQFDDDDDFIM